MNTTRNLPRKQHWYGSTTAVLLVLFGMVMAGCDDFLTEPPRHSLSGPVIETKDGVNALLIGAYSGMKPTGGGWDGGGPCGGAIWEASPDNWVYGSIMGGEAKKGTDAGDQSPMNPLMRGNPDPNSQYLNTMWCAKYEGVARANGVLSVIDKVPETELTQEERDNIKGQALFLRGHAYFELRRMYKSVPWVDETATAYDIPNDTDIWPKVEADFQAAYGLLPATQAQRARVNKWAAAAYLGKTYLQQKKWQEARDILTTVITQGNTPDGKPYGLVAKYSDLFLPATQYNEENVFMIEFTGEDGKTNGIWNSRNGSMLNFPYNSPFRCCGFYQPSQDLINSFKTVNGLPQITNYNATKVNSDQGVSSKVPFQVYTGELDPRLDWTVGRRGLPYLDWGPHPGQTWIRDQAYAGPYAPKKHVYRKANPDDVNEMSWAPGSSVNHYIIRFADVLLMAAEAEAQLGNTAKALEYVNRVRQRAQNADGFVKNSDNEAFAKAVVSNQADMLASEAIPGEWVVRTDLGTTWVLLDGDAAVLANWQEYPAPEDQYEISLYTAADFATKEAALDRILFERKLELAMEGHRLFDLWRWGIAEQYMNNYFGYEGALSIDVSGASWNMPGDYFPIPQRQIDISVGQLVQNDGY